MFGFGMPRTILDPAVSASTADQPYLAEHRNGDRGFAGIGATRHLATGGAA